MVRKNQETTRGSEMSNSPAEKYRKCETKSRKGSGYKPRQGDSRAMISPVPDDLHPQKGRKTQEE